LNKNCIIAIDGPAGSGKSTTARLVAKELNFLYIDSGAIYRAATLHLLREGRSVDSIAAVQAISIELAEHDEQIRVFLNGEDVTFEIRAPKVTSHVSKVSASSEVRTAVTDKIRQLVQGKSVVVEGRDIGSVVFPDADLKIFMQASLGERARRRYTELEESGIKGDLEDVERQINKRDEYDSTRQEAPLQQADDAIVVDTTNMSIAAVVTMIVAKAAEVIKI
jgi:cytidylate kinase